MTYTAEVFVEQLDVAVDDLQCDELIVLVLNGTAEIQTGISVTNSICFSFSHQFPLGFKVYFFYSLHQTAS